MGPKYLIDTNIWIDALNGLTDALNTIKGLDDIAISAITYMEVTSGCTPAEKAIFDHLLSLGVGIIHTDEQIMQLAAGFNHDSASGKGRGSRHLPDAIIGATALVSGRILITRNSDDFNVCKGVVVETPYQGQWRRARGPAGAESAIWVSTQSWTRK